MLGLADVVTMTPEAFAFVSGPDMVLEFTGIPLERVELGGTVVHADVNWDLRPACDECR